MEESEIRSRYESVKPLYERLLVEVETALRSEFALNDITPSAIHARVKDPDRLVEKVSRKSYEDSFIQKENFTGLRIVCSSCALKRQCTISQLEQFCNPQALWQS
jgi:ppGpp synthetase/RelA/SpoT-type nucleotidyltranferase